MDTPAPSAPDAAHAHAPVPSAAQPLAPPPARPMSTGAKWAIGVAVAFVVLTILSCVGIAVFMVADDDMLSSGDSVALIHINGVIAGTGSVYNGVSSPEYILDQLDRALADSGVKAIVLRIDSPGGTVAASQEITLAVRRAADEKPVVASIGDIGASGAYMVAAQCDEIVASPGSSVGSIGVIMEIPNVAGLMEKLGVEFTTLTQGEHKDVGNPFRSVTPTESAMLQGQMEVAYEQFIADVAEGRGLSEAEVRELATGWVWLGAEAIDLELVDTLGNFDDAIDAAADLGGIEGDPYIVTYEPDTSFEDLLWSTFGFRSPADSIDVDALRRLGLPR